VKYKSKDIEKLNSNKWKIKDLKYKPKKNENVYAILVDNESVEEIEDTYDDTIPMQEEGGLFGEEEDSNAMSKLSTDSY